MSRLPSYHGLYSTDHLLMLFSQSIQFEIAFERSILHLRPVPDGICGTLHLVNVSLYFKIINVTTLELLEDS